MTVRVILVCHGSTDAVRAAAFPRDEPLDQHGRTGATELVGRLPRADSCWTSPELRTRQTAEALGLKANVQPTLHECNYGRWAGKTFDEIVADEPEAAMSWLRDPEVTPHGGESIAAVMLRVGRWLHDQQGQRQRAIVVTHPAIIRAAIVHAIEAAPQSFWRIDIAPLSVTRLSSLGGRWNLLAAGWTVVQNIR